MLLVNNYQTGTSEGHAIHEANQLTINDGLALIPLPVTSPKATDRQSAFAGACGDTVCH